MNQWNRQTCIIMYLRTYKHYPPSGQSSKNKINLFKGVNDQSYSHVYSLRHKGEHKRLAKDQSMFDQSVAVLLCEGAINNK